jgi:hypothetical protein
MAYGESGNYSHFEYFTSSSSVDTKGGVQKGPIIASPGKNSNFKNPNLWINLNVGGWMDPVKDTSGKKTKTENGTTIIE